MNFMLSIRLSITLPNFYLIRKRGKMKEKTKVLFVRIPESWIGKINRIAKKECRTQVSVARQAIKEFLDKKK